MAQLAQRARVFSALRHRDFRYYWSGLTGSILGYQVVMLVAQPWLVYELTRSAKDLGLLGLAMAVPTLVLNFFGGVVADKVDQRRFLMVTQVVSALLLLAEALIVVSGIIQVWHVWAIAFMLGAVTSFDMPTRLALMPRLIPRDDMTNAVALNSAIWQGSRIIGPFFGGLLIAKVGVASCFFLGASGSLALALVTIFLHVPPIRHVGRRNVSPI